MPFNDAADDDEDEVDPFSGLDDLPASSAPTVRIGAPTAASATEAPPTAAEAAEAAQDKDDADAAPVEPAHVADESDLPLWMRQAHATVISEVTTPLEALGLDARLLRALAGMGVQSCFPVQAAVVPRVLAAQACGCGGDVLVSAPTGSGTTLAYALPVVQQLVSRVVPRLRALVLLPTRGLAMQATAARSRAHPRARRALTRPAGARLGAQSVMD